jgi:hypothetical protein
VHYHDRDFVRLVARERFEERLREADAERLAREIRRGDQRRRRLRVTVGLVVGARHRVRRPRLET